MTGISRDLRFLVHYPYPILTCVSCVLLFWWLDRVAVFVVLGVSEGAGEGFYVAAHGAGGAADAVNLIPMRIFTKFNCCTVWECLNDLHLSM